MSVWRMALHFPEDFAYDRIKQSYGETYELFYFIFTSEMLRLGKRLRMPDGAKRVRLRKRNVRQRLL